MAQSITRGDGCEIVTNGEAKIVRKQAAALADARKRAGKMLVEVCGWAEALCA